MTASVQLNSTLDGLPKQFVSAMRTLFEIMDDKKTGFVKFSDIENHWQENGCVPRGLPKGVLDSLRKVTPANGLLSFERFCAGLRICLLRHQPNRRIDSRISGVRAAPKLLKQCSVSRPASVPLPERTEREKTVLGKAAVPAAVFRPSSSTDRLTEGLISSYSQSRIGHLNTATVRPNNVNFVQQRAVSMPHLQTGMKSYQPAKRDQPPKTFQGCKSDSKIVSPSSPLSRTDVTMALEKWRMMKSYHDSQPVNSKMPLALRTKQQRFRAVSDVPLIHETGIASDGDSGVCLQAQERGPAAKKVNRRREPRRHTVSNGIDYNMIKRMKILQQEKDILHQGLDAVERARNWYLQQISAISDKLERISKWDATQSEYSMDAHHERLNFQMTRIFEVNQHLNALMESSEKMTRIFEVNQHLNALMESSEKGFPIHMNLAVHPPPLYDRLHQDTSQGTIQRLKDQNHLLTEEIGKKSEIITQLESEKSALVRELFHARSQQRKDLNDTTFL